MSNKGGPFGNVLALLSAALLVGTTTGPLFAQEFSLDATLTSCCEPSCGSEGCCGECGGDACSCGDGVGCGAGVGKKKAKGNPCAKSHKGLFYANDFSYLNKPGYNDHCQGGSCLGDALKLMPVGQCGEWGTLDVGGQLRLRYHNEVGMGREGAAGTPRFQDTENDFLLTRLRLYSNWKINDRVRVYAEGIYADATDDGGDYFARGIDENRGDLLNLFVDLKLTDNVTARLGRQELLYGAQRLVSPLDWANTRRTFDGAKIMYKEGDLAVDSFYTYFVPVDVDDFDESGDNQAFYGTYATYTGYENFDVDAYYLGYENDNATADYSLHTLGLRLNGSTCRGWLWEVEGGPQFGEQNGLGLDHSASFATVGLGRKLKSLPGDATLWCYYDYASGGDFNGFNQQFPLAHKYFGFIDAVQRSNIESPNVLLTMKPAENWNLLLWYWHFMSDTGAPVPSLGNTAAQTDSKELGDELDIVIKRTLSPRSNVLFGWSHFWRGDKIIGTTDADFVYGQYTLNF